VKLKTIALMSLAASAFLISTSAFAANDNYPPQSFTCTGSDPSSCTGYDTSRFMLAGNVLPGKLVYFSAMAQQTSSNSYPVRLFIYKNVNHLDPAYLLYLLPKNFSDKLQADIANGLWKSPQPGEYLCTSNTAQDCPYYITN
jgi:hypothetical protein